MQWIESQSPLVDPKLLPLRPLGTWTIAGAEPIATYSGWLLIRSDNGGWVHLSDGELASLQGDVAPSDPVLDALWSRGVLEVGGRTAFQGTQVVDAIDATHDTFMLVLLLNEGCNLVCSYCYLGHAEPRRSTSMPPSIAQSAIVDAFSRDTDRMLIDFGEVAVAEQEFRELVGHARREAERTGKNLAMSIQTNGTTLDDSLADFLSSNGVAAGISIDGPGMVHDAVRTFRSGRGSHAGARAAIERCKSRGVSVHVPVTIGAHNVNLPDDVLAEIKAIRPGSHLLKPILPQGEAKSAWDAEGTSVDAYAGFMDAVISRAAESDLDLLDTTALKFLRRLTGDRRGWGDSCTSRHCGSGRTLQVVDRHGTRHACPRFVSSKDELTESVTVKLGRKSGTADLLSPALRTPPPSCAGCPWLRSCGGGCTLAGTPASSDVPRPDPHCHAHDSIHRSLLHNVIPRLLAGQHAASRAAAGLRVRTLVTPP